MTTKFNNSKVGETDTLGKFSNYRNKKGTIKRKEEIITR